MATVSERSRELLDKIRSKGYATGRSVEFAIPLIEQALLAERRLAIKEVLVYEADVAAYEAYCADRGEKP